MGYGIICQNCGIEAPSKKVAFHQNIGALVVRFSKSCKGNLCKRCIHEKFWSMTGVTLGIGWFGTISIILGPIFVIMNTCQYLAALGMPGVPADAKRPQVTDDVIARIHPRVGDVFNRLSSGEDGVKVAREIAAQVGVTPGEVLLYVAGLARSQQTVAPPPLPAAQGFPVIPQPSMTGQSGTGPAMS